MARKTPTIILALYLVVSAEWPRAFGGTQADGALYPCRVELAPLAAAADLHGVFGGLVTGHPESG